MTEFETQIKFVIDHEIETVTRMLAAVDELEDATKEDGFNRSFLRGRLDAARYFKDILNIYKI